MLIYSHTRFYNRFNCFVNTSNDDLLNVRKVELLKIQKLEIFCYQGIMRTESGCSGEIERKLCKLKLHNTFAQFQTKKAI